MLVTLNEMKAYLGIDLADTTYDPFLTVQIGTISEAIEKYCSRKFEATDYIQTYSHEDLYGCYSRGEVPLYHYPVISVSSINQYPTKDSDPVLIEPEDYRVHKPTGFISRVFGAPSFYWGFETEVKYRAGFETVPLTVKSVVFSLVEERYNKKKAGIDLNFGSDIQRVSIPGTISIDYDYGASNTSRDITLGAILGNYVNMLDIWRTERAIVGTVRLAYVEVDT